MSDFSDHFVEANGVTEKEKRINALWFRNRVLHVCAHLSFKCSLIKGYLNNLLNHFKGDYREKLF